ncbi:MAG: endonuclease domain-containing protein [Rhodospirillaceae bacterium]|nr:endonuclease domain-containing protein [Rhodospirillaceae bacterium]
MPSIKTARQLRRSQTDAEILLWSRIRARQLCGAKFKRQVPVDNFAVDFLCFEARLIVELDGGQHAEQNEKDAERTRKLEGFGYHVLRFWNNDPMSNVDGVLTAIAEHLDAKR